MSVTTYTTYNDIRSTLGVGDDELEDADIALQVVDLWALGKLEDAFPDFAADFATLSGVQVGNYLRVKNLMILAYTYSVARYFLQTIDNVAYNELSDGRTTVKRIATPLVAAGVNNTYNYLLKKLAAQYSVIFPASTVLISEFSATITYAGSTGLAADPVLGS